jgi:hypothetical protein
MSVTKIGTSLCLVLATAFSAGAITSGTASATPAAAPPKAPEIFLLQNHATGYCLDSDQPGHSVMTRPCDPGNPYMRWRRDDVQSDDSFMLRNVGYGFNCVDADTAGEAVKNRQCQLGNPYMRWKMEGPRLFNLGNKTCLDGENGKNPAADRQCDFTNPYMQWTVIPYRG